MTAYIFCKAYGGLNDALNQLWACTQYAKTHKRTILLDFMDYNTDLFKVFDFSKYPVPITTDLSVLDGRPIEPEIYRPFLYEKPYIREHMLQFNKDRAYPTDVIPIHASAGGGSNAMNALEHLSFTPAFLETFHALYKHMPPAYSAIHIRNTDMATTIDRHESAIRAFIDSQPVYLCSDNLHTIEWAVEKFSVRPTKTQFYGPGPLHTSLTYINERVLYDTIYDLFILASSNKLLIIKPDRSISGFGVLARALYNNKGLLKRLLTPRA